MGETATREELTINRRRYCLRAVEVEASEAHRLLPSALEIFCHCNKVLLAPSREGDADLCGDPGLALCKGDIRE